MNKTEFSDALRRALGKLPSYEVEQSIAFYEEMIADRMEDGMREEEAVAALGPVEAIAAQIIAETLTCVVYIAETLKRSGHTLSTMDEAARAFIANWESEKYRKSLAGKK